MIITIDVANSTEGHEIRRGLADPAVRQFVRIAGALLANHERPHVLCGPRCFLEFLDALTPAATGPHLTRGPDATDPERPIT